MSHSKLSSVLILSSAICLLGSCAAPGAAAPSPPFPITFKASESGALLWPSETETNCPFPDEALAAHVTSALAIIRVLVDKQGYPRHVDVIRDPGFGFARQATECAMDRRYDHGVGSHGEAVLGWTPPLRLMFVRRER